MSGEIPCPACKHVANPVFGLWDSGQLGPQCARCQNPLGPAATQPMPAAMVRDDKHRATSSPVPVEIPEAAFRPPTARPIAKAGPRPARAPAPARPANDGCDDLEILRARLEDITVEAARIRVDVCRLRGLEVEEKHLRREIARAEDLRMKERSRTVPSDPVILNGAAAPTTPTN